MALLTITPPPTELLLVGRLRIPRLAVFEAVVWRRLFARPNAIPLTVLCPGLTSTAVRRLVCGVVVVVMAVLLHSLLLKSVHSLRGCQSCSWLEASQ